MLPLAVTVALGAAAIVSADEARYSLGSIQGERELSVRAGDSAVTTLAFYNIDGNVPTTVDVSVVEAPDDWLVSVERPGATGDDNGVVSLLIQPSASHATAPECSSAQREAVWLPPRGYVCVDILLVRIDVPGLARDGTRGTVHVTAVAHWQTEVGVAPFPQEREFVFDVLVLPEPAQGASGAASPQSVSRAPLLLAGGACLGVLVLLRRLLAKSGEVA